MFGPTRRVNPHATGEGPYARLVMEDDVTLTFGDDPDGASANEAVLDEALASWTYANGFVGPGRSVGAFREDHDAR